MISHQVGVDIKKVNVTPFVPFFKTGELFSSTKNQKRNSEIGKTNKVVWPKCLVHLPMRVTKTSATAIDNFVTNFPPHLW